MSGAGNRLRSWPWSSTAARAAARDNICVRIALTFDSEHPDNSVTDPVGNAGRLLDLLRDRNVRCTFFVQCSWASAYWHLAERIHNDGHLIGSHSHWHCIFTNMRDKGISVGRWCGSTTAWGRSTHSMLPVASTTWCRPRLGTPMHKRWTWKVPRAPVQWKPR